MRKPGHPRVKVAEHLPDAVLALRTHTESSGWSPPAPFETPTPLVALLLCLVPTRAPGEPPWFGHFGFQIRGESEVRDIGTFLAEDIRREEQQAVSESCERLGLPSPIQWKDFLELLYRVGFGRRAEVAAWDWNTTFGRLLIDWTPPDPRGPYRGGISGIAWTEPGIATERSPLRRNGEIEVGVRPRVVNLSRGGGRSQSGWSGHGNMDRQDKHGNRSIVSLRILAEALTGAEFSTLEQACNAWDLLPPEPAEDPVEHALEGLRATGRLHEKLLTEHRSLLPQRPPHTAMSGGTYMAGLLERAGVIPQLAVNHNFPRPVLAAFMAAMHGAAVFCGYRIRDLPVAALDFRGLFAVIYSLTDMWSLQTAVHTYTRDVDPAATLKYLKRLAAKVRRWIANPTDRAPISPRDWKRLTRTLVWVKPTGEYLPHRPVGVAERNRDGYYRGPIHSHVGSLTKDAEIPFVLADLLAAILDGQDTLAIERGIRLVPVGRQQMERVVLPTGRECDPNVEDLVFVMAVERARLESTPMAPKERMKLRGLLKNMVNPGASGLSAQVNDDEPTKTLREQLVWDPLTGEPFTDHVHVREDPGRWYYPPIAAGVQAAGRLLQAIARSAFEQLGGTVIYSDTDSQIVHATPHGGETITAPHPETCSDPVRTALSFTQVHQVRWVMEALSPYPADVRSTFDAWSPEHNGYRRFEDPTLLKWEPENKPPPAGYGMPATTLRYDVNASKRIRPHHLIEPGAHVEMADYGPVVVQPTEDDRRKHSHVVVVNPSRNGITQKRPDGAPEGWVEKAFAYQLSQHYGIDCDRPPWLDEPAVTLIPASRLEAIELDPNLRPYSTIAIVQDLYGNQATTAWCREASVEDLEWTIRGTDETAVVVRPGDPIPDGKGRLHVVRTIDRSLRRLTESPQRRAIGPDGFLCRNDTTGRLEPGPTIGTGLILIGKESRRWRDGRGVLIEAQYVRYEPEPDWDQVRRDLLRIDSERLPALISEVIGIPRRTVQYFLDGRSPGPKTKRKLKGWLHSDHRFDL